MTTSVSSPPEDSDNQIPSSPGWQKVSNARGMPGGGGEMLKLLFDRYIITLAEREGKYPRRSGMYESRKVCRFSVLFGYLMK